MIGCGATQAFAIHPGPIEAARASLPFGQHVAGVLDSAGARLGPLGGGDPLNPIPARGACVSDQTARALGWAAARAFRRSGGVLGSGSSATGAISSVTVNVLNTPDLPDVAAIANAPLVLKKSVLHAPAKGDVVRLTIAGTAHVFVPGIGVARQ